MSGGLREYWELPAIDPPVGGNGEFGHDFRAGLTKVNQDMQVVAVHGAPGEHQTLDANRQTLIKAYQTANSIGDPTKNGQVMGVVANVHQKTSSQAAAITADQKKWTDRQASFDAALVKIGELEDAGHAMAPAFRKVGDAIQARADSHDYGQASTAFDQLQPKLDKVMTQPLQAGTGDGKVPGGVGTSDNAPGQESVLPTSTVSAIPVDTSPKPPRPEAVIQNQIKITEETLEGLKKRAMPLLDDEGISRPPTKPTKHGQERSPNIEDIKKRLRQIAGDDLGKGSPRSRQAKELVDDIVNTQKELKDLNNERKRARALYGHPMNRPTTPPPAPPANPKGGKGGGGASGGGGGSTGGSGGGGGGGGSQSGGSGGDSQMKDPTSKDPKVKPQGGGGGGGKPTGTSGTKNSPPQGKPVNSFPKVSGKVNMLKKAGSTFAKGFKSYANVKGSAAIQGLTSLGGTILEGIEAIEDASSALAGGGFIFKQQVSQAYDLGTQTVALVNGYRDAGYHKSLDDMFKLAAEIDKEDPDGLFGTDALSTFCAGIVIAVIKHRDECQNLHTIVLEVSNRADYGRQLSANLLKNTAFLVAAAYVNQEIVLFMAHQDFIKILGALNVDLLNAHLNVVNADLQRIKASIKNDFIGSVVDEG